MTRQEFEAHLREATLAYQPRFRADSRPVVIEVSEAAHTPAGHALLCALTNQLARTHRRIVFVGDLARPLLCRDSFGHVRLDEASAGLAREINPPIAVDVVERTPRVEAIARLGIGAGGELALGAHDWHATLRREGEVGTCHADIWGAMLASCLGAWYAFQRLLGERPAPAPAYSLWRLAGGESQDGPATGGPLDLGRVMQVGAGGVGAALDYWLGLVGVDGSWTIVDGDAVEVSNLNRQLLFHAADAGYPDGMAHNKAKLAAARLGPSAHASPKWYGDDPAVVEADYDVVLALANERGAREALQDRRPPILLHATTSANHQAQLHRHLPGLDDCIRCRIPGEVARLRCGGGKIPEVSSDAALPYLSGLAGLMLAAAIARASAGHLGDQATNLAVLDLGTTTLHAQRARLSCRDGCHERSA
jgi:molybdopterin-synthase adenylyltransferase